MATKPEILDAALQALREGNPLTIDAVARAAGLTKPGVVHHFATKETLTVAVVDHLLDNWEAQLHHFVGTDLTPMSRLRAYITHALTADLDAADLALMADARLRDKLVARWSERMDPWCGGSPDQPPHLTAARLIADGAWIDRSLGIADLTPAKRDAIIEIALALVDKGHHP